jgi:trk system potassium uptake protein TrkH
MSQRKGDIDMLSIRKIMTPLRTIVLSFSLLIMVGTLLLSLPVATNSGQSESLLTALFTATSAACVTGLVVVDTATTWSFFGQVVIILLIQTGGIGIVTLAIFFFSLLGKKVKLKEVLLVQESVNHFTIIDIIKMMKKIILLMFTFELIGALLLSLRFIPKYGTKGIFMSIFHSISAFCNAGFDILGAVEGQFKSFTNYNSDPLVTLTIAFLIIFGGLGYIIWQDFLNIRNIKQLSYHSKFTLTITLFLLVSGAVFFFYTEYNNPATMASMTFGERLNASFFHSVTTRTAGYNTLELGNMTVVSKIFTVILMFIGGGSGSTAGGVKVTTVGVALAAIISQLKGHSEATAFRHKIQYQLVLKAMTILVLALSLVLTVSILILLSEQATGRFPTFIDILYEVTSAFGTVGLSSVSTYNLNSISRLLLIITMILGKVGPLSFVLTLTMRTTKASGQVILPDGKVVVG